MHATMQISRKYVDNFSIFGITHLFIFFLFFNSITITISVTSHTSTPTTYSPIQNVLLNCGASGNSTALDGRIWIGDIGSKFFSSQQSKHTSRPSTSHRQPSSSFDPFPYLTARISRSQFTYTFQIRPAGLKLIRLYFNAATYPGFQRSKALFTVKAGPITLLTNFSASLTVNPLGLKFSVKEFWVDVEGNQILNITFTPSPALPDAYAFINGIEIVSMPTNIPPIRQHYHLKLSNSDANLTRSSPEPLVTPAHKSMSTKRKFIVCVGATLSALTIIFIVALVIFRRCMRLKSNNKNILPVLEGLCRRFTLEEIRTATNNFDRTNIIGDGGFGRVYIGHFVDVDTPVAIKMLKPQSSQGFREFLTEIEMLSKHRHQHLVSLIGYCNDHHHMIIVYDYMAHGTLRDHLYDTDNPPLSWKQRLEICIGAARGLQYLHAGAEHAIIHRDVKTNNILLDEEWVAKVSDFGLSKLGPTSLSRSHVTTDVKGTFGYLDPEYYWSQKLTVKSDVYGFGVVLFEVLCARPAVDMNLDEEQNSLAQWARFCVKKGMLDRIMDPNLMGKIDRQCLKVYGEIGYKCLRVRRKERPTMAKVLEALEFALELQEIADGAAEEGIRSGGAHVEESSLCESGNQVVLRAENKGGLMHSCPTFWQKRKSHKELLRFFSDKVGLKRGILPTFSGLKACCFAFSEYDALPREQGHVPDSRNSGGHVSSAQVIIEITNTTQQW